MATVLIVDDSVQIHDVLSSALTAAGFTVLRAMDLSEAVREATAVWPDVVLLDFSISERGDAWRVWGALAEVGASRPLRVILYSSEMTEAERTQAYQRGAAAVLDKVMGAPLVRTLKQVTADQRERKG